MNTMNSNKPTFVYTCIRTFFRIIAGIFYSTISIRPSPLTQSTLPPPSTPTILVFNHGNSLGDPVILISSSTQKEERMIRFCAKDSLWSIPLIGTLIHRSGAVPVYRSRDHGFDKAQNLNRSMYRSVYDALGRGDLVGIAPEGVSRFLPYMAKMKLGTAKMALEAVRQNVKDNPEFELRICPCGMTYTHREKFRSDVAVVFGESIIIDKTWLVDDDDAKMTKNQRFHTTEEAASTLANEIKQSLYSITINCPDWSCIRSAMTAARIHRPYGTKVGLCDYVMHLRGWVELLKLSQVHQSDQEKPLDDGGNVTDDDDIGKNRQFLRKKLLEYQDLLDYKAIKDVRVRTVERHGPIPKYVLFLRMVQRALLCAMLFCAAIPGLVLWSPIWYMMKRQEKVLLKKGSGWNDSVAEMKMTYGVLGVLGLGMCSILGVLILWFIEQLDYFPTTTTTMLDADSSWTLTFHHLFYSTGYHSLYLTPILTLFNLLLTVRLYESGMASARSCYTNYKLLFLYDSTMNRLRHMRRECCDLVERMAVHLPKSAKDAAFDGREEGEGKKIPFYSLRWFEWPFLTFMMGAILRREKKDWNEILRFDDHNTMDYVE